MKWTTDQYNSIFATPAQIVVSAAAGSGKTQVLTSRIIERIKNSDNPVSVEKLLIVTFTKAAAAEMKERIGKALRTAANDETDAEKRSFLKKQLMLLGSAHICTIDSFCYDVVRQNFFKANLPSDISIGENGELSLLKLSALEETVDALYCALEQEKGKELSEENLENAEKVMLYFPDEEERKLILTGFEQLTNTFSYDKKDSEFSETANFGGDYTNMISDLHKKSQSSAYPEAWLNSLSKLYAPETDYTETDIFKFSFNSCKTTLTDSIRSLRAMAEISESNGIGYEITFNDDIEKLTILASSETYDELYENYKSTPLFSTLKPKKKGTDAIIADNLKGARNKIKDAIKDKLGSVLQFSATECESLKNMLYPQIKALCSAAVLLEKIYYEKMTARRIIDFSACEHLALKIISEDGITLTAEGEALKAKFDEIYIDEFQDSNNLQDILFTLISKGRTFIVGDVKQSIYGFRSADPTIFMQKCDDSSFEETSEKRKIFLSKNFRSTRCVIDAVNSVFDAVMIPDATKIDYKKEHRLDFGADFIPENIPGDKCEITIIEKDGKKDNQVFNEAIYIAETIRQLISSERPVFDKETGKTRPVMYSDIAVLFRSPNAVSDIYEKVFTENCIPYYYDGGNDLYETSEVGQIIEVLKLIDNSKSDISLACALRSPMFMFNENDLLKIKLASKQSFHESFYGICRGTYPVEPEFAKKCKSFEHKLSLWRKNAGFISIEELIRRIYDDTKIYSSTLALHDGQLRRANLDLLLEKAAEFERSSYTGLFNFVSYVQKIKKTSENVSEAKAVSEKMNAVRIMSIHKSKGLEFPVVFLGECAKKYHGASAGAGGLIVDSHAGIGINYVNPVLRYRYKSPMQHSLLTMAYENDCAEEMRLLYVALSRAREKLYAVATLTDYNAFEQLGFSPLPSPTATEILSCNSFISLISVAFSHGADKFWKVNTITPCSYEEETVPVEITAEDFKENKKISELLDYQYPFAEYINLPGKASVSFLKSFDINLAPSDNGELTMINTPSCRKVSISKPEFRDENQGGVFSGNAHHKFLQYYDYNGKSVKEQAELMVQNETLTHEEFKALKFENLEMFVSGELGKMLKNAEKIYREEPFVINVSANEINSALDANETMCVQGIIDCYFMKDDSTVVLIDYKTDKYEKPEDIAEKYKKQLLYYEKALKTKYTDKIIEKYLYLLHKNDIIRL